MKLVRPFLATLVVLHATACAATSSAPEIEGGDARTKTERKRTEETSVAVIGASAENPLMSDFFQTLIGVPGAEIGRGDYEVNRVRYQTWPEIAQDSGHYQELRNEARAGSFDEGPIQLARLMVDAKGKMPSFSNAEYGFDRGLGTGRVHLPGLKDDELGLMVDNLARIAIAKTELLECHEERQKVPSNCSIGAEVVVVGVYNTPIWKIPAGPFWSFGEADEMGGIDSYFETDLYIEEIKSLARTALDLGAKHVIVTGYPNWGDADLEGFLEMLGRVAKLRSALRL